MNARQQALAKQDEQIAQNVAKIEATRPNAITAMASRLNISPVKLTETLRQTVFRDANDSEFAALIVVANEYRLNPLTKEIFAFKAKGGGVIPYVSVDGWIRIINEHPQFDGMEFEDIFDGDKLIAIECTIWRKDRNKPIKVTEYLDECYRNTEPWNKSPRRFLRHRSLMQCGRVAFGFSGISSDEDYEIVGYAQQDGGDFARPIQPSREAIVDRREPERADPPPAQGVTEIDEEAARALDAGATFNPDTGEIVDEAEEPEQPQTGAQQSAAEALATRIAQAQDAKALKQLEDEFVRIMVNLSDRDVDDIEREIRAAKRRRGNS